MALSDSNKTYANAVRYSLGVSNNACGLLNLIQEQIAINEQLSSAVESHQLTVFILNSMRERVERFIKLIEGPGSIESWYIMETLSEIIKFPDLSKQKTPEEMQAAVKEWHDKADDYLGSKSGDTDTGKQDKTGVQQVVT